jgi:hypothetical protein
MNDKLCALHAVFCLLPIGAAILGQPARAGNGYVNALHGIALYRKRNPHKTSSNETGTFFFLPVRAMRTNVLYLRGER